MAMLADRIDGVIGVDTHRDRHAAAILDRNGGVVAELEIEKRPGRLRAAAGFGDRAGPGPPLLGAGGYRLLRRRPGQLPARPW